MCLYPSVPLKALRDDMLAILSSLVSGPAFEFLRTKSEAEPLVLWRETEPTVLPPWLLNMSCKILPDNPVTPVPYSILFLVSLNQEC